MGISESSSHVARNRACAIAMEVFAQNNDLIEKLRAISLLLRQKDDIAEDEIENENENKNKNEDGAEVMVE